MRAPMAIMHRLPIRVSLATVAWGKMTEKSPTETRAPSTLWGKKMNVPAEGDVGHNGEGTDIAPLAHLGMGRNDR